MNVRKDVWKCGTNVCVALISVLCVLLLSLGAIKICLWLSFSTDQVKLLEPCIPLLEKLVWPLFILFLIFLFKRRLILVVRELPGLVRRSSLPGAQLAGQEISSLRDGNPILDAAQKDNDDVLPFDQTGHDKKVDMILSILEDEIDVRIIRNAQINSSKVVANGAVIYANRIWYIAVLPAIYAVRIPGIISIIQNLQISQKRDSYALLICVYGPKLQMSRNELSGCRVSAQFPVIIRSFDESALNVRSE